MTGLAPIDGLAVLATAAKAAGYGAALLAMGGVLFAIAFRGLADPGVLRLARRLAAGAALVGLAVLTARFGIRAARISGMGWDGAIDPVMLGFVWQSPLGTAAIWRGVGEAAILAVLLPGAGLWIALCGAVAVAVSYAQIGHTLGDPRAALAAILVLHLLAAAFWVGALAPLRRAATTPDGAMLLHRFGTVAVGIVAGLVLAGTGLAWLLSGSLAGPFGTAYGWALLAKVGIVAVLLALAAWNKLRLVPALAARTPGASASLRRSIALEGAMVAFILLATAAITTVTTPPVNL
ncbi:MAG: CopD family protein [Pseudomonadota bacterium]